MCVFVEVRQVLMVANLFTLALAALLVATACAPAAGSGGRGEGSDSLAAMGPKRVTLAIRGNPHIMYQKLNPRSNIPGVSVVQTLVTSGLTVTNPTGDGRVARLAEAPATVENGNWKLFPDGTMETRWTIRPGVVWHDGTPFTSKDPAFTAEFWRDKTMPIFAHVAFDSIAAIETPDERTVVARWNKAYINAGNLFGEFALPLAAHKLQPAYVAAAGDQEAFISNPYWGVEFVGTGPYKVKDWQLGSHLTVEANERYILGRPKIDEVTVKFIPDPNTLGANILAGEVDMPTGGRVDIEWAMNVADQWRAGRLETEYSSMLQIFVQHINPTPPIVNNLDFKRAMIHALDRQTMADILMFGKSSVGHTFVAPNQPEYPFIESAIVKYDYDTRRSLQLLEGLGYTRGADGALRDRAGQQLTFQIRTSQGDVRQEKALHSSAEDWRRLGVDMELHFVQPQRANDREYRSTFPAFDVKGQAGEMGYATNFHSRAIALPENNYTASQNNSRFSRPEMDRAVDGYFNTIPSNERMQHAWQIVRILSEEVGWIGLYYEVAPVLLPNRVILPAASNEGSLLDFVHEWDVRG